MIEKALIAEIFSLMASRQWKSSAVKGHQVYELCHRLSFRSWVGTENVLHALGGWDFACAQGALFFLLVISVCTEKRYLKKALYRHHYS